MKKHPFGNDPAKIERYKQFWEFSSRSPRQTAKKMTDTRDGGSRDPEQSNGAPWRFTTTSRPIIGITQVGWFPVEYFSACRNWGVNDCVSIDMVQPEEWLDDTEKLLLEGEKIDDDILRGVCPTMVAFPAFLPAALGNRVRVLPQSVLPEERNLSWDQALAVALEPDNPWLTKYLDFASALVKKSEGRYPVSHNAELGPTDLHAVLRGHNQSLIDLIEYPEQSFQLLEKLGKIFIQCIEAVWERIPLFHGGFFDSQYQIWAPSPIVRMQEDATASFSPELYRSLVQPVDRMIAEHFPCSFMHLHSTSMFLLDAFLEIEALRCLEINIEPFNIPHEGMVPFFRKAQKAKRSLIVRGSFTRDELKMYLDSLHPEGLYIHIIIEDLREVDQLAPIAGL